MSSSVFPVWHFCEICVPHTTSACHTLSPLSPLSCLSFLHSPLPLVYYFNYAGDKATTATPTHCHLHKVCASCLRFCSCSQKSNKTKSRDGPSCPSLCPCHRRLPHQEFPLFSPVALLLLYIFVIYLIIMQMLRRPLNLPPNAPQYFRFAYF